MKTPKAKTPRLRVRVKTPRLRLRLRERARARQDPEVEGERSFCNGTSIVVAGSALNIRTEPHAKL